MSRHRHRTVRTDFRCFAGAIAGAVPNPMAHGNVTETQRCACGAVRQLNVNGRHVEAGPWGCAVSHVDLARRALEQHGLTPARETDALAASGARLRRPSPGRRRDAR